LFLKGKVVVIESPINRTKLVASDPSAIIEECKWVLSQLEANNFSPEDIFSVHLSLEEAFINAVKHGNKMDTHKGVRIDYSISPNKIEISMTDEGKGFKPDSVPDPRAGNNIYKTGGRGLFLIRAYMDKVEFNESGNCVRMVKHKTMPSSQKTAN
jgi:serine/threonine-protein kinase RsbW